VWRGGLGREQSRRKGGGAFSKCKSRGGKPPTVSGYSAQSLWSRVGHGRARGRSPPRRPPHPPPPPLGPLGARVAAASSRAGIAPAVAREGNRPFRGARAFLRVRRPRAPLPMVAPRARAQPAPVRADRVRHAAGAARRTGRSSPTARTAHAREPADAAADAHAAGGPAAAAAVVHQSSVARGVPTQPIHLSCLASLPNSCRRQTASQ